MRLIWGIALCLSLVACGNKGGNQFVPVVNTGTPGKDGKSPNTNSPLPVDQNPYDPIAGDSGAAGGSSDSTTVPSTNVPSTQTTGTTTTGASGLECVDNQAEQCAIEEAITKYTNQFRAQNGLGDLRHDPRISYIARYWSLQMGKTGAISHDGIASQSLYPQVYGQKFQTSSPPFIGENVAMNPGPFSSADAVGRAFVNQWINSPGHRAQMLKGYRTLGASAVKVNGWWWGTQVFSN